MPSAHRQTTGPCIFCEIVAGRAAVSLVAETPLCAAFLTIGPIRPGHVLVIPRRHVVEYPDLSAEDAAAVFELGALVARRQRRGLGSDGETLFLASGEAGEQSVFHVHLHVVPRMHGDNLGLASWWEARMQKPSRSELDAIAATLRA